MQYSQEGEFLSSNVTSQICNFFIFGVMVVTQKIFFSITMQIRNKAIALYKDILKLWGEIFISLKSCKNFVVGETLILKNVHNTLVCCATSLQKVYQIFIFTFFSTLF